MLGRSHTDERGTEAETTETIDEERRSSFRPIAAGAFGLLTGVAATKPAAARVSMPTFESRSSNFAISRKQATKINRYYTYSFFITNKSDRSRRFEAHGKGPREAYTPRQVPGNTSAKFVLKSVRPLNRIIITN